MKTWGHTPLTQISVLKEIEQTVFDQAELINEEENVTSDRELITVLTKAVAADTGKKGIATQAAALLVAATLLSRGKPKKAVCGQDSQRLTPTPASPGFFMARRDRQPSQN